MNFRHLIISSLLAVGALISGCSTKVNVPPLDPFPEANSKAKITTENGAEQWNHIVYNKSDGAQTKFTQFFEIPKTSYMALRASDPSKYGISCPLEQVSFSLVVETYDSQGQLQHTSDLQIEDIYSDHGFLVDPTSRQQLVATMDRIPASCESFGFSFLLTGGQ